MSSEAIVEESKAEQKQEPCLNVLIELLELLADENEDQSRNIAQAEETRSALKERIVVESRRNSLLEQNLLKFDKHIRRHEQGQISIEEIIDYSHRLLRQEQTLQITPITSETIQLYGNLLWFLQTEVHYLATMLRQVRGPEMEQCTRIVGSLFPNQYEQHEQKLFDTLIQQILREEFEQTEDINKFLRENSAGSKLLSIYTQRNEGLKALRALNNPLEQLLNSDLNLEINPNKVFESLFNNSAGNSWKQGLEGPEVTNTIRRRVKEFAAVMEDFLQVILQCDLPIGLRRLCKVLKSLSKGRFPTNDKIVDSLIGGLIFLRFFNPAIVSPQSKEKLSTVQRRNTVMVAKVLQNLSNGVIFGEREPFMKELNHFLESSFPKIHQYFEQLCDLDENAYEESEQFDDVVFEPVVYLSLEEMTLLHKLLRRHVQSGKLATDPENNSRDNTLQRLIKELDENNAIEKCEPHLDKYVKIRLHAIGDTDRRSHDVSQNSSIHTLKVIFLPVLKYCSKQIDLHLVEHVQSLTEGKAPPPPSEMIDSLLDYVAKNLKNAQWIARIQTARKGLKTLDITSKEDELESALDVFRKDAQRRHSREKRLHHQVSILTDARNTIREKTGKLEGKISSYRQIVKNFDDTGQSVEFTEDTMPEVDKGVLFNSSISLRNILSSDGLIGGLLHHLIGEVAAKMSENLRKVSSPHLNSQEMTENELKTWVTFPRDCKFYGNALEKLQAVGKYSLDDLVLLILNGIPSQAGIDTYENETGDTFNFRVFPPMVSNFQGKYREQWDMLDCVVDLMVVDIIMSAMQQFDGLRCKLSATTQTRLLTHAVANLKHKTPRLLDQQLWSSLRSRISTGWAVVIGQLSPFCLKDIVELFCSQSTHLNGARNHEDIQAVLLGIRYAMFNTRDLSDLELFNRSLGHHLQLMRSYRILGGTSTKLSSYELKTIEVHLITLEHLLRICDYTKCQNSKKSSKIDRELFDIFSQFIAPLYKIVQNFLKFPTLRLYTCRCLNTLLMHSTKSFFEQELEKYLTSNLLKTIYADNKRRDSQIACTLHFLRGGGNDFEIEGIRYRNGKSVDQLQQVIGFRGRTLDELTISLIYRKLFPKKRIQRLYGATATLLEWCVLSIAAHNFKFATSKIVHDLLSLNAPSANLIALRVIEKLPPIRQFLLRSAHDEAHRFQQSSDMESLISSFVPLIDVTMATCDETVGFSEGFMTQTPLHPEPDTLQDEKPDVFACLFLPSWRSIQNFNHESPSDTMIQSYQPYSFSEDLMAMMNTDSRRSSKLDTNVHVELYYQILRVFPQMMPRTVLDPTPSNCSINGSFIGKLICHSDHRLSTTSYHVLKKLMTSNPDDRIPIMKALLLLVEEPRFQTVPCLTTLLSHIADLVKYWVQLRINEDQIRRKNLSHVAKFQVVQSSLLKVQANDVDDGPAWLSWQPTADGTGLVYLAHPDPTVRWAADCLLKEVKHMYFVHLELASDRRRFSVKTNTLVDELSWEERHATLSGIIDLHHEEIMRAGIMNIDKTWVIDNLLNRSESDSGYTPQPPITFEDMVNKQSDFIPYCIGALGRTCVDQGKIYILRETRKILLGHLSRMPSIPMTQDQFPIHDERMRHCWRNYNALYVAIGGIGQSDPSGLVQPRGKGATEGVSDGHLDNGDDDPWLQKSRIRSDAPEYKDPDVQTDYSSNSKRHRRRMPPLSPQKRDQTAIEYLDEINSPTSLSHKLQNIQGVLGDYLETNLWECLQSEVHWVQEALVLACMQTHWESAMLVVNSVLQTHYQLAKNQSKKTMTVVTRILEKIALTADFYKALYSGSIETVSLFNAFIMEHRCYTAATYKPKYFNSQVSLVNLIGNLAGALCEIGRNPRMRDRFWVVQTPRSALDDEADPRESPNSSRNVLKFPNIRTWSTPLSLARQSSNAGATPSSLPTSNVSLHSPTTYHTGQYRYGTGSLKTKLDMEPVLVGLDVDTRYRILDFLMRFGDNATLHAEDMPLHPLEVDEAHRQKIAAFRHCWYAVSRLAALGPLIPSNMDVLGVLLEEEERLLNWILDVETAGYPVLSSLLTFHFDTLLPVYIDKSYKDPEKEKRGDKFFVAIAEAFSDDHDQEISAIMDRRKLVKAVRPTRFRHNMNIQMTARLIHLALFEMASVHVQMRFTAFQMAKSLLRILCGQEAVQKLRPFKLAFESDMSSWARDNALKISEILAQQFPSAAHHLFTEAFFRLKADSSEEHKEWIASFLLPWAKRMCLWRPKPRRTTSPATTPTISTERKNGELKESGEQTPNDSPRSMNGTYEPAPSEREGSRGSSSNTGGHGCSQVLSEHISVTYLLTLFDNTMKATDELHNRLLSLWRVVASSHPGNVMTVLDFVVQTGAENQGFFQNCMPTCKNIMFTIYSHMIDQREEIVLNLTRHLLRVLQLGATHWSKSNLRNRVRSSQMLSVLEAYERKQREAQLDTSADRVAPTHSTSDAARSSDAHDLDNFYEEGLAIDQEKPDLQQVSEVHGFSSLRNSASPKPHRIKRITHNLSPMNQPEEKHYRSDARSDQQVAKEQKQSNVCAAMLVELIGIDPKPVVSFFPVIVIYAVIHLSAGGPNSPAIAHSVRHTMHRLLIRLLCVIGSESQLQSLAIQSVTSHGPPTLTQAVRCQSLEVIWTSYNNPDHQTTARPFVSLAGDHVSMLATDFVSAFCNFIDIAQPLSTSKVGYEALRWAVLSTQNSLSNKAHAIYRTLLDPLNEACIHVLLLSLLSALEDWERNEWYIQNSAEESARKSGITHITQKNVSTEGPQMLAAMILDTIQAVIERLAAENRLKEHPVLLWTAIALIRSDHSTLYNRALKLLPCILQYSYLFSERKKRRKDDPNQCSNSPGFLLLQYADLTDFRPDPSPNSEHPGKERVPDGFWAFSENWSPRFEGIQPYLLHGLLSPEREPAALALIATLTGIELDAVVSDNPTRHLTTLMALLPWLYKQIVSQKHKENALLISEVMNDLAECFARVSPQLHEIFEHFSALKLDPDSANHLLEAICPQIADLYFPQYTRCCATYLTALLESQSQKSYHGIVLKIVNVFIKQKNSIMFVDGFDDIIAIAHDISAQTDADPAISEPAVELITSAITLFQSELRGSVSGSVDSAYDNSEEKSRPELPTSSSSSKRARFGEAMHRKKFKRRRRTKSHFMGAMPTLSLKSVMSALRQVMKLCPMFPPTDSPTS